MSNTFFTSDSHYGHKNIVKSLSDWTDTSGCREFESITAMNDALVEGINSVVQPDDVLYHLGDFNFGGIKNLREFRKRIFCENIHLILGNHDFNHGQIDYRPFIGTDSFYDQCFLSIQPYKEIVIQGQEIILSHYAFRVWNRQSKGSWNLYGHSHGMLPSLANKSMDVGVDRLKGIFQPAPMQFEEIRVVMSYHRINCEDSHDREENSKPLN
jgi:calcineurin-like phosphoesterase family protein